MASALLRHLSRGTCKGMRGVNPSHTCRSTGVYPFTLPQQESGIDPGLCHRCVIEARSTASGQASPLVHAVPPEDQQLGRVKALKPPRVARRLGVVHSPAAQGLGDPGCPEFRSRRRAAASRPLAFPGRRGRSGRAHCPLLGAAAPLPQRRPHLLRGQVAQDTTTVAAITAAVGVVGPGRPANRSRSRSGVSRGESLPSSWAARGQHRRARSDRLAALLNGGLEGTLGGAPVVRHAALVAALDYEDDSKRRFVVRRYTLDPVRRERRHVVVAVVSTQRDYERLIQQHSDDLRRRWASGEDVDPQEHISGLVMEPGHLGRARNGHLARRAIEHGVWPAAMNSLELPRNMAVVRSVQER